MIILHGFCGTPGHWTRVVSELDTDVTCHCPLLPGHMSTSPPPSNSAFDHTVSLLENSLPTESSQDILVGYSLGGRIALHWAKANPKRFSKLILISTSFGIESEEEKSSRLMWDTLKAELLRKKGVERFMKEEWYTLDLFKDFLNSERFSQIIGTRLSHSSQYLADTFEAYSPARQTCFLDHINDLPSITYIYGKNDSKYVALAEQLNSHDSIQTIGLENVGHVAHLEDPSAVARIINSEIHLHPCVSS